MACIHMLVFLHLSPLPFGWTGPIRVRWLPTKVAVMQHIHASCYQTRILLAAREVEKRGNDCWEDDGSWKRLAYKAGPQHSLQSH